MPCILDYPFAGSRMLRDLLRGNEGVVIGRERVRTMMRRMCIEALYRRPNTSKAAPGHKMYWPVSSARHGGRAAEPSVELWMSRLSIPMARGFVYLAAVVDWFTRRVLAWRLSITMEVDFCIDAVEEALAKYGRPEIFNTDQASQFTSADFTGLLLENKIAISMDGRGSWRDNVFVERLWRSVKYEEVYLRAYDSVADARASLGRHLIFYNALRPHSSLDARTPDPRLTSTTSRNGRQHEFQPPASGRRSGRATPSLRNDPTLAHYETNRQVIHLSKAKRCLDQADRLCGPVPQG